MRWRARAAGAVLGVLSFLLTAPPTAADDDGRRLGLLEGIRDRLASAPEAEEAFRRARNLPAAVDAVPVMDLIARRADDPLWSGRAHLWLGHFFYGAGRPEEAAAHFAEAVNQLPDGSESLEAEFWAVHCRSLTGEIGPETPVEAGSGVHGVLGALVRHDGELRQGDWRSAATGYLSLEGEARRSGCLGPLLYRFGLLAAEGGVRPTVRTHIDWDFIHRLEGETPGSPERALTAALAPAPQRSDPGEPAGERAWEAPGQEPPVPFAEPPGGRPSPQRVPRVDEPERSPVGDPGEDDPRDPGEHGGGESAPGPAGFYTVQLGAFLDPTRAQVQVDRFRDRGLPVRLEKETINGTLYHLIRWGRMTTAEEAEALARERCGDSDWRVVRVER